MRESARTGASGAIVGEPPEVAQATNPEPIYLSVAGTSGRRIKLTVHRGSWMLNLGIVGEDESRARATIALTPAQVHELLQQLEGLADVVDERQAAWEEQQSA